MYDTLNPLPGGLFLLFFGATTALCGMLGIQFHPLHMICNIMVSLALVYLTGKVLAYTSRKRELPTHGIPVLRGDARSEPSDGTTLPRVKPKYTGKMTIEPPE